MYPDVISASAMVSESHNDVTLFLKKYFQLFHFYVSFFLQVSKKVEKKPFEIAAALETWMLRGHSLTTLTRFWPFLNTYLRPRFDVFWRDSFTGKICIFPVPPTYLVLSLCELPLISETMSPRCPTVQVLGQCSIVSCFPGHKMTPSSSQATGVHRSTAYH